MRAIRLIIPALLLIGTSAIVSPAMASSAASTASVRASAPIFFSSLSGVAATSSRNAWAVGNYQNQGGKLRTLILRWNGKTWRRVASPNPVAGGAILYGVAATSARKAWAVGTDIDFVNNFHVVIERWNGTRWTKSF